MSCFDTLIFSRTLGLNRQMIIEEVKIHNVNPCKRPGEGKHVI
jgi:hypothetical protein